jgi:hypothetical protein
MKRILKAFSICLLMATAVLSQATYDEKIPGLPDNLPHPPKMEVDSQPDSSLQITAKTKWVNVSPPGIEVILQVKNISNDKAVRAYATRQAFTIDEPPPGCFLLNAVKPGKVLQPGQSEVRSTWRGYPLDSRKPILLFIDFIEFTDGSTWGADGCESAQYLAGARAGARALAERLEKVFVDGGAKAVVNSVKGVVGEIEVPVAESNTWQAGFRAGVESMIDRLRQAVSDGGLQEIEPALKRPYDASGYKIDVVTPESP